MNDAKETPGLILDKSEADKIFTQYCEFTKDQIKTKIVNIIVKVNEGIEKLSDLLNGTNINNEVDKLKLTVFFGSCAFSNPPKDPKDTLIVNRRHVELVLKKAEQTRDFLNQELLIQRGDLSGIKPITLNHVKCEEFVQILYHKLDEIELIKCSLKDFKIHFSSGYARKKIQWEGGPKKLVYLFHKLHQNKILSKKDFISLPTILSEHFTYNYKPRNSNKDKEKGIKEVFSRTHKDIKNNFKDNAINDIKIDNLLNQLPI
jgi:hypothetical protein